MEVFTLNNLICTLLLISLRRYLKDDKFDNLKNGVIVSGLCLTNQHTSVLYIIPISIICLVKERANLSIKFIGTVILYIAMPLSLYLYLPLSSTLARARWSWGDCSTIQGRDRNKHFLECSEYLPFVPD